MLGKSNLGRTYWTFPYWIFFPERILKKRFFTKRFLSKISLQTFPYWMFLHKKFWSSRNCFVGGNVLCENILYVLQSKV